MLLHRRVYSCLILQARSHLYLFLRLGPFYQVLILLFRLHWPLIYWQ